jgi:NAD-dependent DNA ligase
LTLDKFGDTKAQSFVDGWRKSRKSGEIDTLISHVAIKVLQQSSDKLKDKTFCFTGKFSKKRNELEEIVKENGGKAKSSVGSGVILVWDGEERKNKYNKAEKDGNEIISEDDFWELLK